MVFHNYLVSAALLALGLLQLGSGLDLSVYTNPSPEVGQRLFGYDPKTSLGYPHEYGFGHYYQGDILLPKSASARLALGEQFVIQKWTNAIVPYVIVGNFTTSEMVKLHAAFKQFADKTCVRFVPRTTELHYVRITNNAVGCYSFVGRNGDNMNNQINLQTPSCLTDVGTPVHEMMHTLGFLHEMTRPDRDSFVSINVDNLRPEYQTAEFIQANFGLQSADTTTSYGVPYNYGSVMHYSRYAGSVGQCCPVIGNLKLYLGDFGSKAGLTDRDVQQIKARFCTKGT